MTFTARLARSLSFAKRSEDAKRRSAEKAKASITARLARSLSFAKRSEDAKRRSAEKAMASIREVQTKEWLRFSSLLRKRGRRTLERVRRAAIEAAIEGKSSIPVDQDGLVSLAEWLKQGGFSVGQSYWLNFLDDKEKVNLRETMRFAFAAIKVAIDYVNVGTIASEYSGVAAQLGEMYSKFKGHANDELLCRFLCDIRRIAAEADEDGEGDGRVYWFTGDRFGKRVTASLERLDGQLALLGRTLEKICDTPCVPTIKWPQRAYKVQTNETIGASSLSWLAGQQGQDMLGTFFSVVEARSESRKLTAFLEFLEGEKTNWISVGGRVWAIPKDFVLTEVLSALGYRGRLRKFKLDKNPPQGIRGRIVAKYNVKVAW